MRRFREVQLSLKPQWGAHQHSQELAEVARILECLPGLGAAVRRDLVGRGRNDVGRRGLGGDQVLRIALLKQIHGLSYRELAFHLEDSSAFRSFVGLAFDDKPKFQTLQENVKRIRPETWEEIHRAVIGFAREEGIERGRKIRGDTTGVDAAIAEPSDSALLWDCVRVGTRLMERIAELHPRLRSCFHDHRLRAKRRAYEIKFSGRRKAREKQYRDLLVVAQRVRDQMTVVRDRAQTSGSTEAADLGDELGRLLPMMDRVVDQTRRRVIQGESVPAQEKLVSIFEPHTDILVKGSRNVQYGHKVCLTGGASGLVLDCVVESGNPPDATLIERTLRRHVDLFGQAPRQAAFDGGFASKANLALAKSLGVEDVAFHRKSGLEIQDMVRSAWVFRRLRNFRSGIEGCISTLKRAFHMDRCDWRSFASFRAYVWNCVTSFNLIVLARHRLVREAG